MQVTALGHAGLDIRSGSSRLLVDPWLSTGGAFLASWFPFPDNAFLDTPDRRRPDAVLVTHEHFDHLDPAFLGTLHPDVRLYVPRYPSPVLRRKIAASGFAGDVTEIDPWQRTEVAPGIVVFAVCEPPMNHDSAVVVLADGQSLVNLNDARLFPVQLREIRQQVGGTVDVALFQGAGASWYPLVYDYPAERRAHLSQQKRRAKLSYCHRVMRVLEPTVGIPFAGPPAFLDPALACHNAEMDGGIFPDQQQVRDWLAQRHVSNTARFLPGDTWDVDHARHRPEPRWHDFDFDDRDRHVADYAARRVDEIAATYAAHPEPDHDLWPEFARFFTSLLGLSPYFNQRIGMRVGFEVTGPGGGTWSVDFRPGHEAVHDTLGECGYVYRFAGRWLLPVLAGELGWEDLFLSLRFAARRDPDLYNDHLLGLLKFAEAEPLAEVEAFESTLSSDEHFEVVSDGRTFLVARHCPHAGNDLLDTGEVLPGGVLRCLAHHYDFDLATGRCLTGVCDPLDSTEITGTDVRVGTRQR